MCSSCDDKRYKIKPRYKKKLTDNEHELRFNYKKFKKLHCEECGFIPEHKCQLDVDHVDGDHSNNKKENLQTLCANCHRLKTYLNKEGIFK